MAKPGTLKVDHVVVSATGIRYVVRYVSRAGQPDETADLAELAEDDKWIDEHITLPTSELRRVPKSQTVPVEGIPEPRQRCVMCDLPLKFDTDTEHAVRGDGFKNYNKIVKRTFRQWRGYWMDRAGAMVCTKACGMTFARVAWKAGYRIVRKPTTKERVK